MKFNWGHGIALVNIIFAIGLLVALIASFGVDRSLVRDDYYALDLAYQERMNKIKTSKEKQLFHLEKSETEQSLILTFKSKEVPQGSIYFYRPSNESQDFIIDIKNHKMIIPLSKLDKGKWTVKVDWTADGDGFYEEEILYL